MAAAHGKREHLRDITGRKTAEERLRESEERLRAIIDGAPAAIYIKDLDGRHILINHQFEELFHAEREHFLGKTNYDIFTKDDADKLRANDQAVLESKTQIDFEEVILMEDGLHTYASRKFPLWDLQGAIYGICGISNDITERKSAEALSNTLTSVSAAISSTLDVNEIMQKVVVQAARAVGCDASGIMRPEGDYWVFRYIYNLPEEVLDIRSTKEQAATSETVLRTREVFVNEDARKDHMLCRPIAEICEVSAILAIPLIIREEVAGVQYFFFTMPKRFTKAEIDFVRKLSLSVSTALENARLFEAEVEAQRKARYELEITELLLKAADTLSSSISLQEVLNSLADIIRKVTGRSRVLIHLVDEAKDELELVASRGVPSPPHGTKFKLTEQVPLIGKAIRGKRTLVVDYDRTDIPDASKAMSKKYDIKLLLVMPLALDDRVICTFSIDDPGTKRDFTRREIRLVEGIASQAAIVVENARLHERALVRARTFEAVVQMGRLITSTLSMKEALAQIIEYSVILLDVPSSLVLIFNKNLHVFEVAASQGISDSMAKESMTLEEARSLGFDRPMPSFIDGISAFSNIPLFAAAANDGFSSALVTPMFANSDLLGFLVVQSKEQLSPSDEDTAAFRLFATQAAISIRNAERYESERHISDILQEAILIMPEHVDGVEFAYLYRSATEEAKVGGDFYDIFELEHNKIGIIIGDVSGKGIEATALTTVVKNTIKAHAYEDGTPAVVMSKANDLVKKISPPANFVTVFFAILDTKTGNLTYCSAGHPPALIKRGHSVDLLTKHSPIIGAFAGLHYKSGKERLGRGDILIAYTDGLIEARHNGSFFGEERLVEFVKGLEPLPTKEVPQVLFDEVTIFTGATLSDDFAVLAVSLAGEEHA